MARKQAASSSRRVTIVGAFANVLLAAIKATGGFLFGSQALIADAVDSTGDLFSDVVTLVTLRISRRPIDRSHPYGHGRVESLAAMFISGLLLLAAGSIAIKSIEALLAGQFAPIHPLALVVSAFTLATKEGLFRWTLAVARRERSRVLEANAYHHRSDALTSVAVLLGLLGSVLIPGGEFLDSVATLVVVGFIVRLALRIGRGAVHDLVDTAQDPVLLDSSRDIALSVDAVLHAHRIRSRRYGPHIYLDMDIEVDPKMTVRDGHEVAHEVKERILEAHEEVADAHIHVEPDGSHREGEGTVRGLDENDDTVFMP